MSNAWGLALNAVPLYVSTSSVGNVGVGEDDLATYSVPGNSLVTNGQALQFMIAGTIATNVNAKRIRVKFGGSTIFDTGAAGIPISAAIDWTIKGMIVRTGATTQKCMVEMNTNNATLAAYADYSTASETLSSASTLKITGEAVTDNDIMTEMYLVKVV